MVVFMYFAQGAIDSSLPTLKPPQIVCDSVYYVNTHFHDLLKNQVSVQQSQNYSNRLKARHKYWITMQTNHPLWKNRQIQQNILTHFSYKFWISRAFLVPCNLYTTFSSLELNRALSYHDPNFWWVSSLQIYIDSHFHEFLKMQGRISLGAQSDAGRMFLSEQNKNCSN